MTGYTYHEKPMYQICLTFHSGITVYVNQSGLSSDATARTTMGVTVKKCHAIITTSQTGGCVQDIIISAWNDCWNRVHLSCCRKADNELVDVTLSGNLFQNCDAATRNARGMTT